jgi:hypothetical protein
MNTKQLLIALAVVATMSATVVMAEDAAAPAPAAPAAAAPAATGSGHKGRHAMKFEDRKAHALQSLEKRAAKVQQQQACVQATTDAAGLDKCMPKRKGGHRHKHGGKGGADKADTGAAAPAADSAQ